MTAVAPAAGDIRYEFGDAVFTQVPKNDVPNIIRFVVSPRYLNRPILYPRQATLLKLIFLAEDLLTDYDYQVVAEWIANFKETGDNGIQPDIWRRFDRNIADGRPWFHEVVAAIGRRGSKGYIGGLCGAFVTWNFRRWPDPQAHFGIAYDKRLTGLVFGTKKEQARDQQWRDLVNVILGAPCFEPYLNQPMAERLTLFSRSDFKRIEEMKLRGVDTAMDVASFELLPKESTPMAGRGPASYCLHPDTPVLTADLRWVPVRNLGPGDHVVGLDEYPPSRGCQRKLRNAEVIHVWSSYREAMRITFDDDSSVVCSPEHKWFYQYATGGQNSIWREASELRIGDRLRHLVDPWEDDESYEAGYVRGFFDGEGCIVNTSSRMGSDVLFSQNPGPVLDEVLRDLKKLEFDPVPNNSAAYLARTTKQCQQWAIRGMAECLRFMGQIRPLRLDLIGHRVWVGKGMRGGISPSGRSVGIRYKTISKIEHLPVQELVDIETTTHTFIANGLVSHNCIYFDEMAHTTNTGQNREATEVYEASIPALDQFGYWGFLYEGSSTWQKLGQFYANYEQALQTEADGTPVYPEKLMVQLNSWDLYTDWERAHEIEMWPTPEGKAPVRFKRLVHALSEYNDDMRKLERANPQSFAVERRSRWATALNAYFDEARVDQMFEPWQGREIRRTVKGILAVTYKAHADPSSSGANFGFGVAHAEQSPELTQFRAEHGRVPRANELPVEATIPHVVFDEVRAWLPGDYEWNDFQIHYPSIEEDLKFYLDTFMPASFTFDQWNSIGSIQRLREYVYSKRYPKRVTIGEATATKDRNWRVAETTKTALNLGLIHAPYLELAEQEFKFLQDMGNNRVDHPTTGPVQTKDVFDAMSNVIYALIGDHIAALLDRLMGRVPLSASQQGGFVTLPERDEDDTLARRFTEIGSRGSPGMSRTSRPRPGSRGYGYPQQGRIPRRGRGGLG